MANEISFEEFKIAWKEEFGKCKWQPTPEELEAFWWEYQDDNLQRVEDWLQGKTKEFYPDEDMYHE